MSKKVKNRKYRYCAFPMSTANLHVSRTRLAIFASCHKTMFFLKLAYSCRLVCEGRFCCGNYADALFVYGRLKWWYSQLKPKKWQDSSVLEVRHFGQWSETLRSTGWDSSVLTSELSFGHFSTDAEVSGPNQCRSVLGPNCLGSQF